MSAPSNIPRRKLVPHPASPRSPVQAIMVGATRHDDSLLLNYRVVGELGAIRMPELRPPVHTDELWRHTCFEAFVRHSASGEYCEYNFSPSGAWAAYHFSGYRADRQPLKGAGTPRFSFDLQDGALVLAAQLDLEPLSLPDGGTVRLGVTAVIEDRAGQLSYWALKHPAEKPDFHHADSFVIDLS
jgi:hypothetical protein